MSRKTFFVLIMLVIGIISANALKAVLQKEKELNNDDFGMAADLIINADVIGGEKVFCSYSYLIKLWQYKKIKYWRLK